MAGAREPGARRRAGHHGQSERRGDKAGGADCSKSTGLHLVFPFPNFYVTGGRLPIQQHIHIQFEVAAPF